MFFFLMLLNIMRYQIALIINDLNNIYQMEAKVEAKRMLDGPPSIIQDRSRAWINNIIAGVLIFLLQIAVGLLYGLLMFPKGENPTTTNYFQSAIIVFISVGSALFVVVGFGSLMSYLRGLAWSGIGFSLLIFAFSIQMFFLVNALWGWAGIQIAVDKPAFNKNIKQYNMILSFGQSGTTIAGNMITQSFKCGLANIVAFSAIIGRGGPLEAVIISFIGSIGYQLLRVVMTDYTFDGPGTFTVFLYGGFVGLVASFLLRCRQSCIQNGTTADHPLYTSTQANSTIALVGTIFIWIFFPIFSFDSGWNGGSSFSFYTATFSLYYSLCASTIASFVWSSALNGHLIVRDIIFGSISGGIIGGTASLYVVNPVYAMIMGFTAGTVQVIGQNLIEKYWARNKYPIVNSTSFILFGIQGIIGSAFASAWNAIIWTDNEEFTFVTNLPQSLSESHWPFLMGLMSAAWGIVAGIVAGILFLITASHSSQNHFNDYTYWVEDDGINYNVEQQAIPQKPIVVEPQDVQGKWVSGSNLVKSQHAYL